MTAVLAPPDRNGSDCPIRVSGGLSGDRGLIGTVVGVMKIGYARCSTQHQDLTAQWQQLAQLGVPEGKVYVDQGLTGRNRARPGLDQALAAVRDGDQLVITKLDRLARSVPDARDILAELTGRGVQLNIGGVIHDPADPVGRLLFNALAMVAEFEADLASARTREGMAVARDRGRLKGRPPKLSRGQEQRLVALYETGEYTTAELIEDFGIGRGTLYRAITRAQAEAPN